MSLPCHVARAILAKKTANGSTLRRFFLSAHQDDLVLDSFLLLFALDQGVDSRSWLVLATSDIKEI